MLEDSWIKLSSVATGITGASRRAMLEALIRGQDNPQVLADSRRRGCAEDSQLIQALAGSSNDHYTFLVWLS